MNLKQPEIVQIVDTITRAVLSMDTIEVADLPIKAPNMIAACVHITGGWQGAIMFACPEDFAAHVATVMFSTPAFDRNSTDMQDAIAELTNMVGGNLKGLITEACQLSLPAVIGGASYTARVPGSRTLHRVALECAGHILIVHVLEKVADVKAA